MHLPQTGGCLCGKIRCEITETPQFVYTHHCIACQHQTSSAFSLGVTVPETGFRLTSGEPRALQRNTDSGRIIADAKVGKGATAVNSAARSQWRRLAPSRAATRHPGIPQWRVKLPCGAPTCDAGISVTCSQVPAFGRKNVHLVAVSQIYWRLQYQLVAVLDTGVDLDLSAVIGRNRDLV
jgi:hypothetical protein